MSGRNLGYTFLSIGESITVTDDSRISEVVEFARVTRKKYSPDLRVAGLMTNFSLDRSSESKLQGVSKYDLDWEGLWKSWQLRGTFMKLGSGVKELNLGEVACTVTWDSLSENRGRVLWDSSSLILAPGWKNALSRIWRGEVSLCQFCSPELSLSGPFTSTEGSDSKLLPIQTL